MKGLKKVMCSILPIILLSVAVSGLHTIQIKAYSEDTMKLSKSKLVVGIGKEYTQRLKVIYKGAKKELSFASSNSKIAKVSKTGVVTGISVGNATIICTKKGSAQKAKCKVTVRRFVEGITLDAENINLHKAGETYQIKHKIIPDNATIQKLKYYCNDPSVATVSKTGLVTAVGAGIANLTISTVDDSDIVRYVNVKFAVGYDSPLGIEDNNDVDHGKVKEVTYYSTVTGNNRKAMVYTPPQYSENKKYNVLYLCHGVNDTHITWYKNGLANYILDNLYAEGKIADMIVVMPNCYANKNDEDTSIKQGAQYAEFIKAYDDFEFDLEDCLMPFIEKNYSIYTGSEHTALAGLSMGGRETCNIGLRRTDLFGYLGLFSPAPTSDAATNFQSVLSDEVHKQHPPRLVWLSVGTKDTVAGESTEQVKKVLESDSVQNYFKSNGTTYIYYKMPTQVSYTWPEWRNGLYNFTQLLFK